MSRRPDDGQLSFDDLFGDVTAEPVAPRRLLDPAEVGEGMGAATFEVRTGSHCSRCPMRRSCPMHERGRQVTG